MTKKLTIADVDINNLVPNKWNTNVVTPENEEKIRESIKRFGIFKPILVRRVVGSETLEILGGEHRWEVAKKLGMQKIPVIDLGEVDDKRAKEIGLVDNGRYGDDDAVRLSDLLKELGTVEDLSSFLPYNDGELENIFASSKVDFDELEDLGDTDDGGVVDDLSSAKAPKTHMLMRFNVPIEDYETVQRVIASVMKSQGYTQDDSMTNAGNALVYILLNRGKNREAEDE